MRTWSRDVDTVRRWRQNSSLDRTSESAAMCLHSNSEIVTVCRPALGVLTQRAMGYCAEQARIAASAAVSAASFAPLANSAIRDT